MTEKYDFQRKFIEMHQDTDFGGEVLATPQKLPEKKQEKSVYVEQPVKRNEQGETGVTYKKTQRSKWVIEIIGLFFWIGSTFIFFLRQEICSNEQLCSATLSFIIIAGIFLVFGFITILLLKNKNLGDGIRAVLNLSFFTMPIWDIVLYGLSIGVACS